MSPVTEASARATVQRFAPGAPAAASLPGDFVLTHGKAWTSAVIRFGQRLRFWKRGDRRYTHWNHVAVFVDEEGQIVEALGHGVRERNIADYQGTERHVVRLSASDEDREQMVAFACHSIDEEYGYVSIASIGLSLLTGGKLIFGVAGQKICSSLVARTLERAGFVFTFEPSHAMPADLAREFKVPAGGDKGTPPPEAAPRTHRKRCSSNR